MKTKINFSIDSKEITKQLTDVLTAEAVKQARDITQKKFAAELTRKTDEIIKSFDNELQKDSYTYRNGGVFKKNALRRGQNGDCGNVQKQYGRNQRNGKKASRRRNIRTQRRGLRLYEGY